MTKEFDLRRFIGRIAMTKAEIELLSRKCQNIGCFLEIGTLWGGSAIIAGLAGAKKVISVDNQEFMYWTRGDPKYMGKIIAHDALEMNAARFGLSGVIEFVKADSMTHDFTIYNPDVSLIDGNHLYDWVINDWNKMKSITKRYILLHDAHDEKSSDVLKALKVIKDDPDWVFVEQVDSLVMMERKGLK